MPHPTKLIQSIAQDEAGPAIHPLYELGGGVELGWVELNRTDLNRADLNEVTQNRVTSIQIDPDGAVSSVLAAAVINRRFCRLLLTHPAAALASGYRGASFMLSTAEKELLLRIRASTLREFAQLLLVEIQRHNAS